jgi:hypothetical protein
MHSLACRSADQDIEINGHTLLASWPCGSL